MMPEWVALPDVTSTAERTIRDLRACPPLVSLGRYRYLAAKEPLPPQVHGDLVVIALPLRADVEFVVAGRVVTLAPAEVIRIPPGCAYAVGNGAQLRGELLWLLARVIAPPEHADSAGSAPIDGWTSQVERLVRELAAGPIDLWSAPPRARDLLVRALDGPEAGRATSPLWRAGLCLAALTELLASRHSEATPASLHPAVERSLTWLANHLEEPVTVGQLVAESGMSETSYHEAFVESLGTTPKDYVMRTKVEAAKRLLDDGLLITDVAYRLGFSSAQHFSHAFRRYVGTSPSGFRSRPSRPPPAPELRAPAKSADCASDLGV